MATALMTGNGRTRQRTADPFTLMRNLLGFDPFQGTEVQVTRTFIPSFDVKEEHDRYTLIADVPGVKEEDVDISLHNNVLTISGSRQAEERKENETYYLYERQYGTFSRSFSLPDEADGNQVEAHLSNGVLQVSIGKKAESKPRKIGLKK